MKKSFYILIVLLNISSFISAQTLVDAVHARNYDAVTQYIKDGQKVNKAIKTGHFPLWSAIWNHDTKMVELLLRNGADAKQKFKGKDARIGLLEISAQEGLLEITELLVNAGADIHEKDAHGQTPLRIAARNGREELVKYFLSKGSEVDTRGNDGATPLEQAANKGHLEIVKLLLEKGANINHRDNDGDCPLGEAAKNGFIDVVNYLLSKGADASLKNNKGYTAETLARLSGQAKVEALLKEKSK
jgi:uncharacterized protein